MKQEIKRVRAHHGMCLCFFKGKGYSSDFTDNMWDALEYLQKENPIVEIVDWDDHICARCPNLLIIRKDEQPISEEASNSARICNTADKVARYDHGVLETCGLESGTHMHWLDYRDLVQEKIIRTGKRAEICGDCSWNELCI